MELQLANENQLELVVSNSSSPIQDLLISQKELFRSQIEELENIVLTQCNLTGVNPLSQEMAAGALSIQIGKRPRDLLNPKAIKYMQAVFSIKDAITKKETREISALFGVTASQVREFFNSQRARVRKFVRISQENITRSKDVNAGVPISTDSSDSMNPVPLDTVAPTSMESGSCLNQDAVHPTDDQSDKYFVENIFSLMRKEDSFSGQVKLMEWIMRIQNASVLYWFLTNGGVMILASWLTQALLEEQTSVLRLILNVFCHLPLQKAQPVHMSAILQSVNSLRFYRVSDVSNRARILLTKWSKAFARSQAFRKTNGAKSAVDSPDELLLKQSIIEVMDNESWHANVDNLEDISTPMDESSGNFRKLESQPVKLLTGSADDSNKKLIRGSQNRERRKVLLVEQPGQKSTGRTSQTPRSTTATKGRPLSADDIQKAKMRAQFIQNKHGKASNTSDVSPQVQTEGGNKTATFYTSKSVSTLKTHGGDETEAPKKSDDLPKTQKQEETEEPTKCDDLPKTHGLDETEEPRKCDDLSLLDVTNLQKSSIENRITSHPDEPPPKKCKRVQIQWQTPAEIRLDDSWSVGAGEHSKEVEVQKNRIHRERETIYKTLLEIPSNPKEPWDREIDYDDSLTPEIPIAQPPDGEISPRESDGTVGTSAGSLPKIADGMPEPDFELLAALLKNPQLVFALTSGQAGNLSNEETVKLLDMIKANETKGLTSVSASSSGKGKLEEKVEVSLPSPTPSNDPVTGSWKPDYIKNPFSQQKTLVGHDINSTQRTLPAVYSQEISLHGNMVQSYASPQMEQQLRAGNFVQQPQILPATVVGPQPTSTLEQLAQQLLPQLYGLQDQRPSSSLPQNVAAYTQLSQPSEVLLNSNRTSVSRIPQMANPLNAVNPAMHDISYPTTTTHRAQAQVQQQPSYIPEPQGHSWWPRQGVDHPNARYQNEINPVDYKTFAGPQVIGEPGFETWSQHKSPMRSHRYTPGLNYQEHDMNQVHSYRPERQTNRHSVYPSSSGYQEPGMNDANRWRDRRR
ncbi:OLC1v1004251C1 [Oldenlandia corymbosa var. corymbosa]|uniref:OLC1v1004251C1 n=1 Tax=Oldenlandia corymbosa var. corymbosa TaxID=529605 RepID=A0AAV1DEA5_OLDCO|nr:OLC1v1004251C1 [Oldenlandia corymbosa var. corymbosa]